MAEKQVLDIFTQLAGKRRFVATTKKVGPQDWSNPSTWGTLDAATANGAEPAMIVGLDWLCIDIDHGMPEELRQYIVDLIGGATELSRSGRGFHIWVPVTPALRALLQGRKHQFPSQHIDLIHANNYVVIGTAYRAAVRTPEEQVAGVFWLIGWLEQESGRTVGGRSSRTRNTAGAPSSESHGIKVFPALLRAADTPSTRKTIRTWHLLRDVMPECGYMDLDAAEAQLARMLEQHGSHKHPKRGAVNQIAALVEVGFATLTQERGTARLTLALTSKSRMFALFGVSNQSAKRMSVADLLDPRGEEQVYIASLIPGQPTQRSRATTELFTGVSPSTQRRAEQRHPDLIIVEENFVLGSHPGQPGQVMTNFGPAIQRGNTTCINAPGSQLGERNWRCDQAAEMHEPGRTLADRRPEVIRTSVNGRRRNYWKE